MGLKGGKEGPLVHGTGPKNSAHLTMTYAGAGDGKCDTHCDKVPDAADLFEKNDAAERCNDTRALVRRKA